MNGNLEAVGTSLQKSAFAAFTTPGGSSGVWRRESDRRRSDRLAMSVPARLEGTENVSELEGAELVNIVDLSLGGATLETASRLSLFVSRRLSLGFGEAAAEVMILPYHCWLHQLFYAPRRSSKVLYRVRVTFQDPSVPALNLIYRMLLAHWNAEG